MQEEPKGLPMIEDTYYGLKLFHGHEMESCVQFKQKNLKKSSGAHRWLCNAECTCFNLMFTLLIALANIHYLNFRTTRFTIHKQYMAKEIQLEGQSHHDIENIFCV